MLLPELVVCLVLLQNEIPMFLTNVNWVQMFLPLLEALDKLNGRMPGIASYDSDDLGWPGVLKPPIRTIRPSKIAEELPLIRRADLDNHNLDGGLWIVINDKVYDVQDFR